ncbi:hypothetical protein K438DRAFT_1764178 [Mycena galopus ATCC 62051]|nr:hypothetical protein K438DRAFT_1764178 [Mycena galopus ATCC 62051]
MNKFPFNWINTKCLLTEPMFLNPNHYTPLYLGKEITVVNNTLSSTLSKTITYQIEGDACHSMAFSYIVQKTHNIAIGPLEYYGNTHLIQIGSSDVVMPCYGDPNLPKYYAVQDLKHRLLPQLAGARWPELSTSAANALKEQVAHYGKGVMLKHGAVENNEQDCSRSRKAKETEDQCRKVFGFDVYTVKHWTLNRVFQNYSNWQYRRRGLKKFCFGMFLKNSRYLNEFCTDSHET